MTKKELIKKLVSLYKLRLNPQSKFYTQDIQEYKERLSFDNVTELKRKLSNLESYSNEKSSFNKTVKKEISKMDKNGLFDINKIKSKNMLD